MGTIPSPNIEGLKRRDALLLLAIVMRTKRQPARGIRRARAFARLYVQMRFSVRRRAQRLEERGFLEPGWSFAWRSARATVTPLGRRAATVAAMMFELEAFDGLP
jgi:hypothetical protein